MTTPAPLPAPDSSAAIDWRIFAWAALPPLAVLMLRVVLPGQVEGGELQRLQTATLVSDPAEAFWMAARPLLLTLLTVSAVAGVFYAALRRLGWARMRPGVLTLWVLLWLAMGAWLMASDMNRAQRQPLPDQAAKVLLAREILPNKRTGPGGTEVYFELPGEPEPLRLFAQGQPTQAFVPGSTAVLHAESGRWWGRWGRLTSRLNPAPTPTPAAR
ncbi:hypothetical protein [Ottowia testudinis]|uniref:Uncharacterized protein n=1 Tax=Ottowia testudinis TaxID=2816950 RepID=A0A975CF54_9BURK|nr:hypothetical protein [Ottowia testudinis]QTD45308.1 hypothetical protein J1M35_20220 [Ottowia testudinis]